MVPRADQRCSFFQWQDQREAEQQYANTTILNTWPVKDMFVENKRMFGHSGFRVGQQVRFQILLKGLVNSSRSI